MSAISSPRYAPPSVLTALTAMASLSLKRTLRGRTLWISMMFGALPVMFAVLMQRFGHTAGAELTEGIADIVLVSIAISAAMNAASSVGEEIEERTMGYLWSRPLARWTIVAGKLLALVPIIVSVAVTSAVVAHLSAWGELPSTRALISFAVASAAYSVIAAGIATLTPKHGLMAAISYTLFFDMALGALPISIRQITISYHTKSIAGISESSPTSGAIGVAIITAIWAVICLQRIRRIE
jgi:ABC-type Na+ efflux pump permease subunit